MNKKETRHKPCKHRRRETINGCTMDMCYAIGFERVGDMPCEYCSDWSDDREKDEAEMHGGENGPSA